MINMDISNYTELNEEDKKGIEEYLQSMYPDENIQLVEKNDVFTDAFFSNVVEICDSRYGQVSGNDMEPIISWILHYLSKA